VSGDGRGLHSDDALDDASARALRVHAYAASINPRSTSHKLTSTMRAKNGIAACGANHHRGQQSAGLRTDFRKESAKSDLDDKTPGALSRDPAFITASMC
jgi:hypothetical protein